MSFASAGQKRKKFRIDASAPLGVKRLTREQIGHKIPATSFFINAYIENFKGDRKFALEVKKTYDKICRDLSNKARVGSKRDALELMNKMSEQNIVLYFLGFKIDFNGKLIKL